MKAWDPSFCEIDQGEGPLVATAVHNGSGLRAEVEEYIALGAEDRLREEDPHTGAWTTVAPTRLVALHSRFEVDLNRPREKCVYRLPEDAWGLRVWGREPPPGLFERSIERYDAFYSRIESVQRRLVRRYGKFVLFDLHSYNHRRSGPGEPPADPDKNPEINVGTGTMLDRSRWAGLIDRFIGELSAFEFLGRRLDVRENVKFFGGNLARRTHQKFPETGCVLAIEVKKFFMDEWSGELDQEQHAEVGRALAATVPGVLEELGRLGARL